MNNADMKNMKKMCLLTQVHVAVTSWLLEGPSLLISMRSATGTEIIDTTMQLCLTLCC
jgi:hypothetical protein